MATKCLGERAGWVRSRLILEHIFSLELTIRNKNIIKFQSNLYWAPRQPQPSARMGPGYENNFDLITKIYCLKKYSSSIIHLPKSFPSRAFAQRLQWMWGCSREVGETVNILRHISSESEKWCFHAEKVAFYGAWGIDFTLKENLKGIFIISTPASHYIIGMLFAGMLFICLHATR